MGGHNAQLPQTHILPQNYSETQDPTMQGGGVVEPPAHIQQSGTKFDELYKKVLYETEEALSHTRDEAEVRLFNAANSKKNGILNGNHSDRSHGSKNAVSGSKRNDNNNPALDGAEQALEKSQNSQRSGDSTSGPRQPPKPTPRQSSRDKLVSPLNQSDKLMSSHNQSSLDQSNEQHYSETFEKTQSDISEDIAEGIDDEDLEVPNNSPYKGDPSDDDSF